MGFSIGICVETTLGTGVVVDFRREDDVYVVRLWKPRGTGSAKAYLNPASILRELPAALGLRVNTPDGAGTVVSVMSGGGGGNGSRGGCTDKKDVFLVELLDGESVLVEADRISTPVAKVMPLVERVLDRGSSLVTAETKSAIGTGARDLVAKIEEGVQGVDAKAALEVAAGVIEGRRKTPPTTTTTSPVTAHQKADGVGHAVEGSSGDSATGIQAREGGGEGSDSERAVQLEELSRAETGKIEALLESGRQRLEDLIDAAMSTGSTSGSSGATAAEGRGVELMRLWEEGKEQLVELAGKGGEALELDKHFSTLKKLSEDSPELAKIVADLESGAAKARELQSQLEATKTVGVLMDGKARLEEGLGEVINSYRGDGSVAMATERGGRLLKALTEKESPVMTKGMKLLQGAQERVAAQGDSWKSGIAGSSLVVDGQSRLSGVLRAAAETGGGAGVAQDVLGLLKGDPSSRATEASLRLLETSILAFMEAVPPPRPRALRSPSSDKAAENSETGGSESAVASSEDAAAAAASEAWCAQDLVDLFESGQLAEEVMRGMAQQASAQALTIMDRLSEARPAEGSPGMEALRLLRGYERGEAALDDAMTCALDFLNSEEGQSMAGELVSKGERGLESLKGVPMDGAVGAMLEKLADPRLEKRIMDGIESLDTDELLETAERAMTDAGARSRLLDGIKDSTVDFLLEYLPHIEVPPISGTSARVGYAITNLDLSGFRLRKEDVEVQLVDLSDGLEVAVKEGGTAVGAASGAAAGAGDGAIPHRLPSVVSGGGGASTNSKEAAGVGSEDYVDMAAVPWGAPSADGALSQPGEGSFVSPFEQRRQAAYTAVLGGAGSARLPEELQASRDRSGREGHVEDGAEFAEGVFAGRGVDQLATPPPPPVREEMAPAEVLRVVARGVRAEFKTLQWACRQETFPYAHGTGTADAVVVDGYVSLGFSIKRGIVDREKGVEGPLLVLSTRTVTLDRLDLTVANCRMAWLINILTKLFSSTISTYVCRSLQEQLDAHASDLLATINSFAEGSWPFLLSLTSLKLEDFPLASESELAMARGEGRPDGVSGGGIMASITGLVGEGGGAVGAAAAKQRAVEEAFVIEGGRIVNLKGFVEEDFGLVFDEDGPLGLQVDIEKGPGSGRVVISGLQPDGQAERLVEVPEEEGRAQAFSLVGAELLSVGSSSTQGLDGKKVLGLLRSSPRPVQMTFRCSVPDVAEAVAVAALTGNEDLHPAPNSLVTATFTQKSLGIKFRASTNLGTRVAVVGGFSRDQNGRMREAEASGLLFPGQLLYSVNGKRVMGQEFQELVRGLQRVPRPVTFVVAPSIDVDVTVERPPSLELDLRRVAGRVVVAGFCEVPTALEASGAIQPGDTILSANGIPMPGAGCYRKDVALLEAPGMFPMRLRIKRADETGSGMGFGFEQDARGKDDLESGGSGSGLGGLESSLSRLRQYQQTGSVSASSEVVAATPEELSLKVEEGSDGRPVVVSMPYVKGELAKGGVVQPGMVLVAINGAPIPGGHFGSVPNCRRALETLEYPSTLTFRDMPQYLWMSRILAMRSPS